MSETRREPSASTQQWALTILGYGDERPDWMIGRDVQAFFGQGGQEITLVLRGIVEHAQLRTNRAFVQADVAYDDEGTYTIATYRTPPPLLSLAAADPLWLHGGIPAGPVQDVALMAWAIRRGMGSHWSTFKGCGGEGK